MNTTTCVRRTAATFVFAFVSGCLWTATASADVDIYNDKGWRVYTNGRVGAFGSYTFGDGYPVPAPGSGGEIGSGLTGAPAITDDKNNISSTRIRSGFVGSILALGAEKHLTPETTLGSYFAIWSGIQGDHSRFHPVSPDVREAYLKVNGPWGSVLAGRSLGLFGKTSTEIDFKYGHGYGLGFPCDVDNTALASCGQIGFGVLFPFFSAGIVYASPSLAGFTLSAGVFDPVILAGTWELTPLPRPEGQLAYDHPIGNLGSVHLAVEGLWQRVGESTTSRTADASGIAGGGRLEIGRFRLGVAGHYGTGLGFYYPLFDGQEATYAALPSDPPDLNGKLRTYSGYYGQVMVVLGNNGPDPVDVHHPRVDIGAGYGDAHLYQIDGLDVNRTDGQPANNNLPKDQIGINGEVYYHIDENLVLSADYFRANFTWYDGGKQGVNTMNVGLTMVW